MKRRFSGAIDEILSHSAVGVNVHETGDDITAGCVYAVFALRTGKTSHIRNHPVFDPQVTDRKTAGEILINVCVFYQHDKHLSD